MNGATLPLKRLGRTDLMVAPLAVGTWGFLEGHPQVAEEAKVGDADRVREILRVSFEAGINLIDAAADYRNEALIGQVLADMGDAVPQNLIISTKFGHGAGFDGAQIRASVEDSLRAWQLDRIPLMMLHDPRSDEDLEVIFGKRGALAELRRLQDEGLVQFIGAATGTLPPLHQLVASDEFDVIQFPRLHTLLNQSARNSGLLEAAKARDIGTILTSPFAGNILATGTRGVSTPKYCFIPAQPEVVAAVARMEARADELGVSLPAAAIAFVARERLIDVDVVGVTSTTQVLQNVAAALAPISAAELQELVQAAELDDYYLGGPTFQFPLPAERLALLNG